MLRSLAAARTGARAACPFQRKLEHYGTVQQFLPRGPCSALPRTAAVAFSTSGARPLLAAAASAAHRAGNSGLNIGRLYSAPAPNERPASFADMGLHPPLLDALAAAGLSTPTPIQSLAIPAILDGKDYLLASQTGSGKTLAYLLPLVSLLKRDEDQSGAQGRPKRPRMLVMGPTKELTEQIASVAKSLCHHAKFRVVCCNANSSIQQQAQRLAGLVDVVVATPQRILQHQELGNVALGGVQWLVVDEADTMFDSGGFADDVRRVLSINKRKSTGAPVQVVLASATMTRAVKRVADETLPELTRIEAPGFHRPVPTARHDFLPLSPGADKLATLLDMLPSEAAAGRRVLVFCGSVGSCRAVEHACVARDLPSVCYHGDMPIPLRKEAMARFAADDQDAPRLMVATDLAARGLDFAGRIDHVVNFDFPLSAIDYLHRAGRTARAGATGRVTSLLGPRDRSLARAIQHAMQQGLPLDAVTASGSGAAASSSSKAAWSTGAGAHTFKHMRNGKPLVPFNQVLAGKSGEERKRLIAEIAEDVKAWRQMKGASNSQSRSSNQRKAAAADASPAEGRRGARSGARVVSSGGGRGGAGGRGGGGRGGGGRGGGGRASSKPRAGAGAAEPPSAEERWKERSRTQTRGGRGR